MKSKKLVLAIGLIALIAIILVMTGKIPFAVVAETYDKTFSRTASSYPALVSWYKDCSVEANYNSGSCTYLDFCYAVLPKTSTSISDAVAKDCVSITPNNFNKPVSLRVVFTPAKGMRYAVITFYVLRNMTAVYQNGVFTGQWQTSTAIPDEYKTVEEVVGYCPNGQMLKGNMCMLAQGICIDQFKTNMCTNQYEIWCLAYRYGTPSVQNAPCNSLTDTPTITCSQGTPMCDLTTKTWKCPIFECGQYPEYACADRDKNGVCDEVLSVICSDINHNNICDSDDQLIQQASCIDANMNGICDNVEKEGVFCPTNFDPVCVGGAGGTTYPNECFAKAAGQTSYTKGACQPLTKQCDVASDCPIPQGCLHVTAQCINYMCSYAGQCGQCTPEDLSRCPAPPCVGVAVQCVNYMCSYAGKCLTQPERHDIWKAIIDMWNQFWAWVLSKLGWL
jgi:hypothetical protein